MKYAVATVLDQTIGYYAHEGATECAIDRWTTRHPDAVLFETETDARAVVERFNYETWIEEVADEAEFRGREDTW